MTTVFKLIFSLALVNLAQAISSHKHQDTRPNFLLIFADDIGWGDLGANWGQNRDVTPNLNKLSESGKRFTDFHAAASVCGPSRASLLTGRLGLRNGITHNFGPASVAGLPRNETTLAEVLKENGYNTGMIGKWHLGITKPYHPCSRGFNYYYGLPYSNDMGCVDVDSYNLPQCKRCPKSPQEFEDRSLACSNDGIALPLFENYDIIEQPANLTALGDRYVEKATSFLKEAKSKNQPFFLYVAPAHTHVPLAYAKRFTNSTSHKTVFSDTLHELDDMIGRIVTSMKDNGLYDNTITWFTGDNGPWSQKCQYSGSPGPYLGSWQRRVYNGGSTAKATTWEAGHREPTFVIWPGFVQANTTSRALASALDIFPTFLSIANVGLPPWREYDGVDITEVLLGHQQEAHKVLFHPNSGVIGRGNIETLRFGPYKVYWRTGGLEFDCQRRVALPVWHRTPVVFNVDLDPAESEPLTSESEPALDQIISDANHLRTDFLLSVKTDNTTVADFSHSKAVIPCCDPTQYYCRCKRT